MMIMVLKIGLNQTCFVCRMLEDIEGPQPGGKKAANHARDRANQLFQDLDRDGDGCITVEEFVDGYIKYRFNKTWESLYMGLLFLKHQVGTPLISTITVKYKKMVTFAVSA